MGCCSGPKYLGPESIGKIMIECMSCHGWGSQVSIVGETVSCSICDGTGALPTNEDNTKTSKGLGKENGKDELAISKK